MVNAKRSKIAIYSTVIIACGGIYFTIKMAQYGFGYITDYSSPVRTEYLEGVYLSLICSLPFWVIASGLAREVKAQIPALIYKSMCGITISFCSIFALSIAYTLLMAFLDGE